MTLGAEHEQAAGIQHLLLFGGHFSLDAIGLQFLLRPVLHLAELVVETELDIAAELDVGAAARHVGGDGHRAGHAGLGDDLGLLLVIAGVQHVMGYLALLQQAGKVLRFFDRHRAHQHRLADLVLFLDRLGNRLELVDRVLVELVFLVDALDSHIGRNLDHV